MRDSRIFRPLPSGASPERKGFFVRKRFAAVIVAAVAALSAVPAHAASVTVSFGLSAGAHAPTGAACSLSVPAGSDGVVVLSAAKAEGCIVSYVVENNPTFGAFLKCINEVCGESATGMGVTYWKFYENGAPAPYGISSYSARAGSEVVFSYTTWAGCLTGYYEDPIC